MFTKIVERYRSRVVLGPKTTASNAAEAYLAPTPGVMGITLRCVALIGASTALKLSLKHADSAAGDSAADFADVPIYVDGIRQAADGHEHTLPAKDDTDIVYIVDFCIDPAVIPDGKLIGIEHGVSAAANILSVEMIEDVAYKPTPA